MENTHTAFNKAEMASSVTRCLEAKKDEKRNTPHQFMDKEVVGNLGKGCCIMRGEGKRQPAAGSEWGSTVSVHNAFWGNWARGGRREVFLDWSRGEGRIEGDLFAHF